MAKIIRFVDAVKHPSPQKPKVNTILNDCVRCLSDIDKLIENHFNKMTCP